jgi:ribonuclease J
MGKMNLIGTNTLSINKDDTSLSFYGGVNEIGGNKIMVTNNDIGIFLDFGKSFANEKLYYDDPYIIPRVEEHFLGLGLLPGFCGLYKNSSEKCNLDAIILTHAHLDHIDSVRYLKDCFPIYCGETTETIIRANEESGRVADSDYRLITKTFKSFRTGNNLNFDNIKIEPIHVEHSVPGSYGLLLETNNGSIGYTGDFRMNGSKMSIGNNSNNMTNDFIEKAKGYDLDVLITEATNIDDFRVESEEEVMHKLGKICENTKGLIMAGVNKNDIDRLRSFHTAAISHGRILAISGKQAYLVNMLKNDKNLDIFRIDDPNVNIFMRHKKTESRYEKFLKDNFDNIIYAKDVHNLQKELILIANLYDMNELIEIQPMADSIYLLSTSEPFDEEGELRHDKLKKWMDQFGMPMCQIHVSGHATAHELKNLIKEIRPKTVIPVHTNHPELFKKFMKDVNVNVEIPVNYTPYLCKS